MLKAILLAVTLLATVGAGDWNTCKFWTDKYLTELTKAIMARESDIDPDLYEGLMRQYGIQVLGECREFFDEDTMDIIKRNIRSKNDTMGK